MREPVHLLFGFIVIVVNRINVEQWELSSIALVSANWFLVLEAEWKGSEGKMF